MLLFRVICAILMAWATNWVLSRDVAAGLLQELPEMSLMLPIGAAAVGYFNLAVRQGWGFVVAAANGVWAGALAILTSCVLHLLVVVIRGIQTNVVKTFDNFLNVFSDAAEPLMVQFLDLPILSYMLGAALVVGLISEVLHWVLVRFRQRRAGSDSKG